MSVNKYNTNPAANSSVGDGSEAISIQEGMPRDNVSDAFRTMASDIAKNYLDQGSLVTSGSGAAFLVSTQSEYAGYFQGMRLAVQLHENCASGATINVNSMGAKSLRVRSKAGVANVASGDLRAGEIVDLVYNGTQFHVVGGFDVAATNARLNSLEAQDAVAALEGYDTPAEAIAATIEAGRKVISVGTNYDTPPSLPDRGSVVFAGSGSFPETNQDGPTYRRQVIPELAPSARPISDFDLSSFTELARETSLKICVVGDSLTTWNANQIAQSDGLTERLEAAFKAANPDIQIEVVGRGIGGQKWDNLDATPAPEIAAIYPWYTTPADPWLDYVEAVQADVVVISLGMNDRQNFNRLSFESVLSKIDAFAKPTRVVLCTPLVPTLSPHPNFADFGTYADQEGRDWNAGYVRSWAKFYGIPLLDINRTFNMVRDGRDVLDCSFVGLDREAVSPAGNWQATPENACRDWSAVVEVKAAAWTSPEVFHFTKSTAAGNVGFIRDNGAGFLEFKLYRGPGALYSTITTDIATPTTDVSVEITLAGNEFSFRIYAEKWATDPVKVPVIRNGGLYRPVIGYLTGAAGAVDGVTFSRGIERAYLPTGTDLDIWGVQNATAAIDPNTGGGGPNHPTSKGAALVYGAHFAAQDFSIPIPETDRVEFRSQALTTATDIAYDLGESTVDTVTVKFLATVEGAGIASISNGNFVGQFVDVINAAGSAWPINIQAAAIEGNGITLAPGNGVLLVWDGTSWVRRTDTLSQGDIANAVAAALASYPQVASYGADFTPVLSFSTGGSFNAAPVGHYEVIGGVVHWWIYYNGTVTQPSSVGAFNLNIGAIGATPATFNATAQLGLNVGITKGSKSGQLPIGVVAYHASGSSNVALQKEYPSTTNQNLLSSEFAASVEFYVSGSFVAS